MKYFLVGIISVLLSVGAMYLMRPKNNNALIEYQFKQNAKDIREIHDKINVIQNDLKLKHEKIDSANKPDLRGLFNDFGKRTRRHDLLRIK